MPSEQVQTCFNSISCLTGSNLSELYFLFDRFKLVGILFPVRHGFAFNRSYLYGGPYKTEALLGPTYVVVPLRLKLLNENACIYSI